MRMWVLRIPNGHFPFRPLLPQASSPHTHTHTWIYTHRETLCDLRTRLSAKYWLQASFEASFILSLCSVLLLLALPLLSHCSPCSRLLLFVCFAVFMDKNQTDPVLTYVTAASWCRSPRALCPLFTAPFPLYLFCFHKKLICFIAEIEAEMLWEKLWFMW